MKRFLSKLSALALMANMLLMGLVPAAFAVSNFTVSTSSGFNEYYTGDTVTIAAIFDSITWTDVTVDWGDNTFESYINGDFTPSVVSGTTHRAFTSHDYATGGTYTVEVTVYENTGSSIEPTTETLDLDILEPTVDAGSDVTIDLGDQFDFSGFVNFVPTFGTLEWGDGDFLTTSDGSLSFSFDSSQGGYVANESHTYAAVGEYTVSLLANDTSSSNTLSDSDEMVVTVVDPNVCVDDANVGNDSIGNRVSISEGTVSGQICNTQDEDYYSFAADGGTVTFTLDYDANEGPLVLYVMDTAGRDVLGESFDGNGQEVITLTLGSEDLVYPVVYGNGVEAAYTLTTEYTEQQVPQDAYCEDDAYEPNNGRNNPTSTDIPVSFEGLTACQDWDYYQVNLAAGESIVATLDVLTEGANLLMGLQDEDGFNVEGMWGTNPLSYYAEEEGTYYLTVVGQSNEGVRDEGIYDLSLVHGGYDWTVDITDVEIETGLLHFSLENVGAGGAPEEALNANMVFYTANGYTKDVRIGEREAMSNALVPGGIGRGYVDLNTFTNEAGEAWTGFDAAEPGTFVVGLELDPYGELEETEEVEVNNNNAEYEVLYQDPYVTLPELRANYFTGAPEVVWTQGNAGTEDIDYVNNKVVTKVIFDGADNGFTKQTFWFSGYDSGEIEEMYFAGSSVDRVFKLSNYNFGAGEGHTVRICVDTRDEIYEPMNDQPNCRFMEFDLETDLGTGNPTEEVVVEEPTDGGTSGGGTSGGGTSGGGGSSTTGGAGGSVNNDSVDLASEEDVTLSEIDCEAEAGDKGLEGAHVELYCMNILQGYNNDGVSFDLGGRMVRSHAAKVFSLLFGYSTERHNDTDMYGADMEAAGVAVDTNASWDDTLTSEEVASWVDSVTTEDMAPATNGELSRSTTFDFLWNVYEMVNQ